MDPATLAAAAVTIYVLKFAAEAAKSTPGAIKTVWDFVTERMKKKDDANQALSRLESKPDDKENRSDFEYELKKLLRDDATFKAELEEKVKAAEPAAQAAGVVINVGDISNVHGSTLNIAGGNVTTSNVSATGGSVAAGRDIKGDINTTGKPDNG